MSSRSGNARENRTLELLQEQGWFGICGRASRGPADILAIRRGEPPMLVQVKGDKVSPWAHFRREEREALLRSALDYGGVAWLCWMPSVRKPPVWYAWHEWPAPVEGTA